MLRAVPAAAAAVVMLDSTRQMRRPWLSLIQPNKKDPKLQCMSAATFGVCASHIVALAAPMVSDAGACRLAEALICGEAMQCTVAVYVMHCAEVPSTHKKPMK